MILLDADILLIDIRYQRDSRFGANRQVLDRLRNEQVYTCISSQAMLEVVGILSFDLAPHRIPRLIHLLPVQYRLTIVPDPPQHPEYASCSIQEVVAQMCHRMALGDAVQAVQIAKFAQSATCLLSWNARHFAGKLSVPALTPQDWLAQQAGQRP